MYYRNNLKPIGLNDLPCEILHKIYMINIKDELNVVSNKKKYNNVVKEINKNSELIEFAGRLSTCRPPGLKFHKIG